MYEILGMCETPRTKKKKEKVSAKLMRVTLNCSGEETLEVTQISHFPMTLFHEI